MTMASGRPRRTGVWLLAGLSIVASLGFLAWRVAGSSDGAAIAFYAGTWSVDGVRIEDHRPAGGLVQGDVVTAVAGRPLAEWLDGVLNPGLDRSALSGSRSVTYTVRRDGATLDVAVALGPDDVGGTLVDNWSALLFTLVLQVVAGYVLWRRPEASAASALALASVGVAGSTLPWFLGIRVSDIVAGWPFVLHMLTASGLYMVLWPAGALHLPLAVAAGPAGPCRRALALAYGLPLGAYGLGLVAARLLSPSSTAWLGTLATLQALVIIPSILAGIGLTIRGHRAATPAVRDQVRWMAIGGGIATLGSLLLLFGPQLLTGRPILPWSAVGLVALPLPLGIAAGILRYRLFDIDVAINRALVYGGATTAIVAIYAVSVTVLGTFLRIQGGFPASLLATGLAAVVALPIRDALQLTVNRLMYGDRDDPYRALARLGQRLEGTLDPIQAPTVIVRTVAESLRLPWVAIRIGPGGEGDRTIVHGRQPAGEVVEVPLVYRAEVVGDLLVAPRSAAEPLSAADRKLLDALAQQAGAAVHALGLTLDLIESRERLVVAREEERRRIRRDLHDGLGPTLAAIGMRAEVAAELVAGDPAGAERILAELRAEVQGALADIRRLVDALRPPALDEMGLVGALRAQAGHLGQSPGLEVAAQGPLPELPAAIEVAAYRIAVEAMTNASRHAQARTCRVRLAAVVGSGADGPGADEPGVDGAAAGGPGVGAAAAGGTGASGPSAGGRALEVEVTDDGRGLPARLRPGIGLASMRERAAEVGGTCVIERMPGGGTRVFARLPLDDRAASQG
ncbi:MAG: sensor histidine kinase [Chloroflexi bacterium]|nr:sensor histidine kinase [Chloroflexota bacterium]